MLSAPETVMMKVLLSQHTGATADVTADAQVPRMTETLSTSISLRAARTAASGLVWSSSMIALMRRPITPPALLTSSNTSCIAFSMRGPSLPPAPVSGVRIPTLIGSACARPITGSPAAAADAAAPLRMVLRLSLMTGPSFYFDNGASFSSLTVLDPDGRAIANFADFARTASLPKTPA